MYTACLVSHSHLLALALIFQNHNTPKEQRELRKYAQSTGSDSSPAQDASRILFPASKVAHLPPPSNLHCFPPPLLGPIQRREPCCRRDHLRRDRCRRFRWQDRTAGRLGITGLEVGEAS